MALYEVTSSSTKVMNRPSNFAKVLATLYKGARIDVISISRGFAYLKYNNLNAYTLSSNLTKVLFGSVTIKYIDESSLTEIATAKVNSNLALGSYSYTAIDITGYTISGSTTQSVTLTATNLNPTITFKYKKAVSTGTITVKYVNESTLIDIATAQVISNLAFGSYSYNSIAITGYTISGASTQSATINATTPNATITFKYTEILGTIIVKYLDSTSIYELAPTETFSNLKLGSYTYTAKTIAGYTLSSASSQTITLTADNLTQRVLFTYNQILGTVTVKYIDKSTSKEIYPSTIATDLPLGSYSYNAKVIQGYSLVGDLTQSVTLTESSLNKTITFSYTPILGSVTIKYIDETTLAEISTPTVVNNLALASYSYSAKSIDGYSLVGSSTQSVTLTLDNPNQGINFKYSKILGKVVVKYVDKNSNLDIIPAETYDSLELGSYNYTAKLIDGYTLTDDLVKTVVLTASVISQTVTFKYSKVVIEVPTNVNINEVPYISTYYIKPIVKPNEEVKIDYYITDYYHKEYIEEDFSETFTVTVRVEGQADKTYPNLLAGDHTVSLGKFTSEGDQKFSILCTDKYGRNSHELFNFFLVRNEPVVKEYVMTTADLAAYNIKNDDNYQMKVYVKVDKLTDTTVGTNIETVANSTIVPSKKYICFIGTDEVDTSGNPIMKTKPVRFWLNTIVKYADDYDKAAVLQEATNTRLGLQKLLDDKKAAGFTRVKLLSGVYRIDNTLPIYIPSNFTVDMNGGTLKLNQFTGNKALMMDLNNTFDSHVINGIIEGDYFSHDYVNSPDNPEWVSGIQIGGEAKYSSYENLTVKNITGYGCQNGLANSRDGKLGYTYLSPKGIGNTFVLGDIDRSTGLDITSNNRTSCGFIDITGYTEIKYLSVSIYLGYQGNPCGTWNLICHFYDSNKKFIKSVDAYQYRRIGIPTNSKYLRVTILNEAYPTNLSVQYFRVPTHCSFKNINHENVRCVGMATAAMKDMLIENCEWKLNGQSGAFCAFDAEDGWDMMQDCTFKSLNFHDNYRNDFLTCAGHNFIIDGQISGKIYIWERTRSLVVRNCSYTNISLQGGGVDSIVKHGVYRVYNNNFIGGSVANNLSTNLTCTGNVGGKIKKSTLVGIVNGSKYTDCLVQVSSNFLGYISEIYMKNCKLTPNDGFTDRYMVSFNNSHTNSCIFENCEFNEKSRLANHNGFYSAKFINCKFENTTICPNVNANSDDLIIFENCNLGYGENNLIYYSPFAYTKGTFTQIEFNNCTIKNIDNNTKSLIYAYAKPNGYCNFNNCIINIPSSLIIFDGVVGNINYITNYIVNFTKSPLPSTVKLISDTYKPNTNIKINLL